VNDNTAVVMIKLLYHKDDKVSCGDDKAQFAHDSPWSCANCATVLATIFCALVSMIVSVWP